MNLNMWRKLADGEHPFDGGPFGADHIKVFRDDARIVLAELRKRPADELRGVLHEVAALDSDPNVRPGEVSARLVAFVMDRIEAVTGVREPVPWEAPPAPINR